MTPEQAAEFNRIAVKTEAMEDARDAMGLKNLKIAGYMDPTFIYNKNQDRSGFQFLNAVGDDGYNYDNSYFGVVSLDLLKEMDNGTKWHLTLVPGRGTGAGIVVVLIAIYAIEKVHQPGGRVVACSDAADAFTMIQQSISSDDPVIFFEHRAMLDDAYAMAANVTERDGLHGRRIGGALANYFESFEPLAMRAVMERGLQRHAADPVGAAAALRRHAQSFSWDAVVDQHVALCLGVVDEQDHTLTWANAGWAFTSCAPTVLAASVR